MMKTISKGLSILLHPLFMPIYGVILIFNSGSYLSLYPYDGQKAIFIIIALSTIVLPLSIMVFFVFLKIIKSLELHERQERILPYIITLGFYYFAYFTLKRATAPNIVVSIILASILALSVTLLLSIKFKISAHMVGIGGLAGAVIGFSSRMMLDVSYLFMAIIIVAGILASARLFLQAHKPVEIYTGFTIGSLISVLTVIFL